MLARIVKHTVSRLPASVDMRQRTPVRFKNTRFSGFQRLLNMRHKTPSHCKAHGFAALSACQHEATKWLRTMKHTVSRLSALVSMRQKTLAHRKTLFQASRMLFWTICGARPQSGPRSPPGFLFGPFPAIGLGRKAAPGGFREATLGPFLWMGQTWREVNDEVAKLCDVRNFWA